MEQAATLATTQTAPRLAHWLGHIPTAASWLAISAGAMGLVGNWLDAAWLMTASAPCPPMKTCCASGLFLLGCALWFESRGSFESHGGWRLWAGRGLGGFLLLMAFARLAYYGLPTELDVPLPVLCDANFLETLSGDRPPLLSTMCVIFLGLGLMLADARVRGLGRVAQWCGFAAALTAALGMLGYVYCGVSLFSVSPLTRMPPHGTLGFFMLGLGLMTLRPDDWLRATLNSPGPGGMIARRFLPAAIAVPIFLSSLRLMAEMQQLFDTPFGIAILTLANVVVFIVLVAWGARTIDKLDLARHRAADALADERADLERRVAERSRELAEGNRALRVQIEQRRRLEAKTRANEARLRRVVESDMIGIFFWQADGVISEANEAFLQLVGYSCEDVAAGRLRWTELTPPEFRGRDVRAWEELARRGVCTAYEKQYIRSDQTRVSVLIGASTLDDERRQGVAYVIDITERKQLERQLHQRVDELAEADRRKNEFLALLGHELRNPLAAIDNALRLIPLLEPTDPDHEHAWGILLRQSGHITRLVDDLLDVSRVSRGKIKLKRERMAACDAVQHAVDVVRPITAARQQQLHVDLPDEPIWLEADPARFEQILVNLLDNAAKYTPEQGSITIAVRRDGDHVAVSVRDTGIGMDAELLPRVFELFSQAMPAGVQANGGLGIGLFLVAGLVRLHQGSVTAMSAGHGRGSEFTVRLPALAAVSSESWSSPRVSDASRDGSATSGPRRVLLVEDNADVADMLMMLLAGRGFDVQVAGDGPTALAKAAAFMPDIVLMDIGLPGMSGYEAARRLRRLPNLDRTLLIAVTGFGENEAASRSAGFDHHLVKPVAFDRLLQILAEEPVRTAS